MASSEGVSLSRSLGASEENWTRSTAGGTGIAVFGIALKRHVDINSIELAAKKVAENHALLRVQIAETSKGKLSFELKPEPWTPAIEELPWPTVVEGENNSGVLVLPDAHKHPGLSSALHEIVTNELNISFLDSDKAGYPLDIFQIHVYFQKHHHQTIIILRFHSGAFDRHSSVVAAQEFLSSLNAAVDGKDAPLSTASDKNGVFPSMEDLIPKGKASKGFLKKGLDAVGYAVNSVKNSLLPFQPGFAAQKQQPFRSEILSYTLGISGTEALMAACKKENTTYAAALAAAILKAAANVKELKDKKQDAFSFTSVLSCRPFFEPPLEDLVLGNYSAGLPQDEQVKENVSFWDLARRVSASTQKELSKSRQFSELSVLNMLFSQVLKHPSLTPNSSLRTSLFTLFVDGPVKIQVDKLENLHLAGTFGPFASMHFIGPCLCVGEALNKGPELSLSFIYPTPVYSRSQLEAFVTSALDLLKDTTKGY
ncbi:hypothetical protein O6H91_23G024200 [Diphasiastrum complanatum]|uniref:Uncharacterized protein n=8 Tax=Diphasiastrum complanatum TaxID=34168 RepID=A0ACC2A8Z7_DIPCM|nr:hypothetical protein O6H91_23G024200 [Diphasiastrum complanatum]KAJ7514044.1 hypothetical protein O6H91_23G024200 [Diphasiastrum complanatum]KAJ7514045.1 hypothetical protein O6H91_23G024200 [Diphasiastrum complanatum]KAJ7514046.1 hypothetical protein O6H91_23G024200 [Diphasiastrum complanatum]KAJ7514047.1 hypothetical protein O6H91_23G024200 [Diphasiastrum complanatum]